VAPVTISGNVQLMVHIYRWLTANGMITAASLDEHFVNRTVLCVCSYTAGTAGGLNL
jgi:hypothetical protein